MINIPFFTNLDPILLVTKLFLLAFILIVLIISFIFLTQVRSLNKVVTILASFSSTILQTAAFLYFLAMISLFVLALVIL